MIVRGAPLIGATAAYGLALAMRADASDAALLETCDSLRRTRPTAVNLSWALDRMRRKLQPLAVGTRRAAAYAEAARICEEDVRACRAIGANGLPLLSVASAANPGRRLNILTHCNAGWLATVDYGTALAPIYAAAEAGIDLHVWVDETRPRNQGASLTAFELGAAGINHTIIADNAGGHLMQRGDVDLCIVGADRVTATGDVANKIGTYLKPLAASASGLPFYVAAPLSTIDFALEDGLAEIPIETRRPEEVTHISGRSPAGAIVTIEIGAPGSPALNPAFDVTPAALVSALITERGVAPATKAGLAEFRAQSDALT